MVESKNETSKSETAWNREGNQVKKKKAKEM